ALVEREPERERVAAGVAHVEELADRGDVRFAVRAVQAFGDVEDYVGPGPGELQWEFWVCFQAGDGAGPLEGALDGGDGGGVVPLRVAVVGPRSWGHAAWRLVLLLRLLVVGEPDVERHGILRDTPLRKGASPAAETRPEAAAGGGPIR